MARDTIYEWSQTAASNATADATIDFAEFQRPSTLNDSCRALMARIAQFLSDAAPNRSSTSSGNAYAVASDAAGASLTNCEQITFIPDADNTGACTLNVDGRGAKAWRPAPGVEFESGNILTGVPVTAYYRLASDEWLSPGTGYYVSQSASGVALQSITARLPQIGDLVVSYAPTPGAGRIRLTESTQSVLKADYPELNNYLSGISYPWGSTATHFSLPPAAGYFLRFAATTSAIDTGGARTAGSTQSDQNKTHTHTVTATGTTNTTGAHAHTVADVFKNTPTSIVSSGGGPIGAFGTATSGSSGDHSHTVSVSGTAAGDGGDEVRVKNVAFFVDVVASSALAAAQLAVFGYPFQFDTGTTDSDPGAGRVRLNHATLASATYLYISNTDGWGVTQTGVYAALTNNCVINLSKVGAQANRVALYVSGTPVAGSGYYKIPVTVLTAAGAFSSNDQCAFEFSLTSADANVAAAAVQAAAAAASAAAAAASASVVTALPLIFASTYGVSTTNSAADNTTAMNDLIAVINATGGTVLMPQGTLSFNAWNAITGFGVTIRGAGKYAGGTVLSFNNATGDCITVNGAAHFTMDECWITAGVRRTSGFAIKLTGSCFIPVLKNLRIDYHYDGIWMHQAAQARMDHISWRYMLGTKGIYTGGASGGVYGLIMTDLTADNPVPTGAYGTVKTWTTSTAYTANDIVLVNGNVYQCSTSGTSSGAGTGPSTIPGTGTADAFSSTVTDGTAAWKFVMKSTLYWLYVDSFTYSVTVDNSALISGVVGVLVDDSVASGSSYPIWINTHGLEVDHPYDSCVYLSKGEGVYMLDGWLGSALQGRGVYVGPSFRGEVTIGQGTRIAACWLDGVYLSAGPTQVSVNGACIYGNSLITAGSYHGVSVAAGATRWSVMNSTIGKGPGSSGGQGYGVNVAVGASDYYAIMGNLLEGNATGAFSDGGTGTEKEIAQNVGSVTPRLYATSIDVGHASDTTITRSAAGLPAVEGVTFSLNSFSRAHTAASLAVGDSNFQLAQSSGNPFYGFDANDYMLYDRTTNVLYTVVGAAIVLSQTAARISGSVPFGLPSYTVAGLPTGAAGDIAYASNGRKNGEGAGSGTGVLVFKDGTAWRACDTGATVAA
ncbi:MAG: hypothetical protein E6Q97_13100 [Desulfurellales bacterium]|nr:MAG: hypothetical protein E6Q97_13100 [Desulfurellales bacterium]